MIFEPLQVFQKVLVRDSNEDKWTPDIFRLFEGRNPHPYYCMHSNYKQCIPYNEETAHLLGTTDSPMPPEPEFEFGDRVEVSYDQENWLPAIFYRIRKNCRAKFCVLRPTGTCSWPYCRKVS